ncbi:MAG: glycosyltransferase family 2 protein [Rhodospirillales bacterium]|jgi:glycosyltransferase involved in cell wall biosynthesis
MSAHGLPTTASPEGDIELSALVVAHDEEANLPDCLERLRFADEIVVLLDRCSDGSRAVAERFGARILEGAWPQEGERRNTGIAACRGRWILEIDADERLHPDLAALIRRSLPTLPAGHVLMPIDNLIGARRIVHGWVHPIGNSRRNTMFSRGTKSWGAGQVHPEIRLSGTQTRLGEDLPPGHRIDHLVDRDIADFVARIDRYSSAMARDWRARGISIGFPRALRKGLTRALKSYTRRSGWREGRWGLFLASMACFCMLLTFFKTRLEQNGPR